MDSLVLSDIRRIKEASDSGNLVVFVGAGVSKSAGIPLWAELIGSFKDELSDGFDNECDFLKIAEVYKNYRGDVEYLKKVKQVLNSEKVNPNELHKSILNLNPCHIITTNYDDLLEKAIEETAENYFVIAQDDDLPKTSIERYLIKMHGDLSLGNIVLTETDYLNYSNNFPLIQSIIQSLVATKTILFIGFSFSDYNLKVITNMVIESLGSGFPLMYMLDLSERDNLEYNYLLNRGVKTITYKEWFPKKHKLERRQSIDERTEKTINSLSLIQSLENHIISKINLEAFLKIIDSYFKDVQKEISYLGIHGIKEVLSKKWLIGAHYTWAGELIIRDNITHQFVNEFKNSAWNVKKRIVLILRDIFTFLAKNNINKINVFSLQREFKKDISSYYQSIHSNLQDKFFIHDAKLIKEELEKLKISPYNTSGVKLLKYPFILYKLGHFEDSLSEFEILKRKFIKENQEVLLLLTISNIIQLKRLINGREFYLSNDLKIVINKLRNSSNHNFLADAYSRVVEYKMLFQILNSLYAERDKIKETISNYQWGGFNSHKHEQKTQQELSELENWSNRNYVISDYFTEHKNCFLISFENYVLLNKASQITPINRYGGMNYLPQLEFHHVKLGAELSFRDLIKVFERNNINSITISTKCYQLLNTLFNNVFEDFFRNHLNWKEDRTSNYTEKKLIRILYLMKKSSRKNDFLKFVLSKILNTPVGFNLSKFNKIGLDKNFVGILIELFSVCDYETYSDRIDETMHKFAFSCGIQHGDIQELIATLLSYKAFNKEKVQLTDYTINLIKEKSIDNSIMYYIYSFIHQLTSNDDFYIDKIYSTLKNEHSISEKLNSLSVLIYSGISLKSSLKKFFLDNFTNDFDIKDEDHILKTTKRFYALKLIARKSKGKSIKASLKELELKSALFQYVINPKTFNEFDRIERSWLKVEFHNDYLSDARFKSRIKDMLLINPDDKNLSKFFIEHVI